MNAASNFAYLKKKKAAPSKPILEKSIPVFEDEEPDTNVISVTFNTLKQAEDNIQMGDAYFCKHCKSCLSSISKLLTKPEYQEKFPVNENKEEEKEERKQEIPQSSKGKPIVTGIKDSEKVWVCEFCGEHNLVNFDQEELPKIDDVIYLLKSAQQINKNSGDMNSDITTVFCIDNSGSMSVTHEIKGNHDLKHGLSPEEYEMLKQFIEAGADQYLPRQKKGTTFISRKQCVLGAIESQLLEMREEFPNRKVGLVTFDNEVNVIGDGKNIPETVAGDKLYKYDVLRQIGEGLGSKLIATTVKESAHTLISKFEKLKESGKTALGPALLVSLGLALQGKQGSRIILCTDGLANVGLGEMDTPEGLVKAEQFYTELAQVAKEQGVSISVMSIKGEGCKLDILGKVADVTSGSLTRVDPNEMGSKFASMMKQEVIGTQVEVKLRLHRGMRFRNEAEENLKEKSSLYEKDIGNVTAKTELTFEYEMRPDEELVELEIDASKIESVPFQAQIIYTSSNGDQLMRVITKTLKTTQNQEEAEKDLNINLLAARALQQQAQFAAKGLYMASNEVGGAWGKYFDERVSSKVSKQGEEDVISKYKSKNTKMQQVSSKRSAPISNSMPVKEKEKPVPLKAEKMEKPKPVAASSLMKDKAPPKPVSKAATVSKPSLPMKKSAVPTKALPVPVGGKKAVAVEKMKKEVVEEEDGAEEDAEYELFHEAKNCNSNFE